MQGNLSKGVLNPNLNFDISDNVLGFLGQKMIDTFAGMNIQKNHVF